MILIDCSHALHRTLAVNKDKVNEDPNFIAHLFINQILSFSSKLGGSKKNRVVLCYDSHSWRKKYYLENRPKSYGNDTYKGQRVKDETIDWKKIYETIDCITESLKLYSDFIIMKVKEAEADDIIAVLANKFKKTETIWIASSDKDFVQLQETPNVNIYDPLKQQFKPTVDKDYFKKMHIMLGDSSDNIKSIKERLGEKTASKLIKELDLILQTNPTMKERFDFNQTLIDFDFIPDYIKNNILIEFDKNLGSFNALKLMKMFTELRLVQHTENINKFKLSDNYIETKLNMYYKKLEKDINTSKATLEDFFN